MVVSLGNGLYRDFCPQCNTLVEDFVPPGARRWLFVCANCGGSWLASMGITPGSGIDSLIRDPHFQWPGKYRCKECTLLRCSSEGSTCAECSENITKDTAKQIESKYG